MKSSLLTHDQLLEKTI